MELTIHIVALVIAYMLDRLVGDPEWMPHPVVLFGKFIAWCDSRFNRGQHRFIKGMVVTIMAVVAVYCLFWCISAWLYGLNLLAGGAFDLLVVFYGLAGTTLIKEGKAVFEKLEEGVVSGRRQLSRIVGRDTEHLSTHEIKTATLETMAENLSDGVIAPLFWLGVAGIPGMMAYKMVNTLDSMIGYRNAKYEQFGKCAARLDDAANFIPARITAFLMGVCAMSVRSWQFVRRYGKAHTSPNAGYPEAALAGILDLRFGGNHIYFGQRVSKPVIGNNTREPEKNDLIKTIKINRTVEVVMLVLVVFGRLGFRLLAQ